MNIKSVTCDYQDNKSDICKIRFEVFVDEQNVSEELEIDGLDDEAKHVLAYIDDEPMWQEYESEGWAPTGTSPSFEQNELLTQQINKLIHPDAPGNWWGDEAIVYPAGGFNFHAMDRPGQGPLSYEYHYKNDDGVREYVPYSNKSPMALFLDKVSAPFYKQLLSDSEKGYIQDSIWSTPKFLQGGKTRERDGTRKFVGPNN